MYLEKIFFQKNTFLPESKNVVVSSSFFFQHAQLRNPGTFFAFFCHITQKKFLTGTRKERNWSPFYNRRTNLTKPIPSK